MRKVLLVSVLSILGVGALGLRGQSGSVSPVYVLPVASVPSTCFESQLQVVISTGALYSCAAGTPVLAGGGAGTVTHTLGPLTLGAIVLGNGGADITVGGASEDSSGDISTPGVLQTGVAGTVSGSSIYVVSINLPSFGSGVGQVPTSGAAALGVGTSTIGTSYGILLPTAAPTAANSLLLFPSISGNAFGQTTFALLTPSIVPSANLQGNSSIFQLASSTAGISGRCVQYDSNLNLTPAAAGCSSTTAWSALGNATAALSLSNSTFGSTFSQTSAVTWEWLNSTASTSSASQSSPLLELAGTYWTGSASATDSWTLEDVLGSGTNGTSTLQATHSGTSGRAEFNAPQVSAGTPPSAVRSITLGTGLTLIGALGTAPSAGFPASSLGGCYLDSTQARLLCNFDGNSDLNPLPQVFFGTAAPGSVTGNLPGDIFSDTTNHNLYICNAPKGTTAPACTSVASGSWTATSSGSGGSGTVNSGTAGQVTWYASTGTAVSGNSNITLTSGGNLTAAGTGTFGTAPSCTNSSLGGFCFSTAPSGLYPAAVGSSIASASTIAPTSPITHVTGTTTINTITAPSLFAQSGYGGHLILIPDGLWSTGTSGNIAIGSTAVVSKALILTYDNGTSKWYPSY